MPNLKFEPWTDSTHDSKKEWEKGATPKNLRDELSNAQTELWTVSLYGYLFYNIDFGPKHRLKLGASSKCANKLLGLLRKGVADMSPPIKIVLVPSMLVPSNNQPIIPICRPDLGFTFFWSLAVQIVRRERSLKYANTVKLRAVDRSTIQFLTILGVLLTETCYFAKSNNQSNWTSTNLVMTLVLWTHLK